MKTKAVRMYGKMDLRLEEFELPEINEDEILAEVVSDSLCMSTYKAAKQGADHKRVPKDIDKNPVIVGHELCGKIIKVGGKWQNKFKPGKGFAIQPAHNYKGTLYAPGYSYKYIGGDSQYIIIPHEIMDMDCLLPYNGEASFYGSLSEPMSCIIGGFHAMYHTQPGKYVHEMGIRSGGAMAIMAGAGPMGMGAIDYAIHCDRKPAILVVTDIDDGRLQRASSLLTVEDAAKNGVRLFYVNTAALANADEALLELTQGKGFDDVFVFAPVKPVAELADRLLAHDGCMNFFAGPTDPNFSAMVNMYNVHYKATHLMGTTGGNTDDIREALEMMEAAKINPAAMISHVGGLDSVADITKRLGEIRAGKMLVYVNIKMEMTPISEFEEKGRNDPMFAALAQIVKEHNGLWCAEAEKFLLEHSEKI